MLSSLQLEYPPSVFSLRHFSGGKQNKTKNSGPQTVSVKFKGVSVAFADGDRLTRIKEDPHGYLISGARTSSGQALAMDVIVSIKLTFRPFQAALGALSTSPSVMLVGKQITLSAHEPVSPPQRQSSSPLLASPTKRQRVKEDAGLEPPKLAEGHAPKASAAPEPMAKPLPKAPDF